MEVRDNNEIKAKTYIYRRHNNSFTPDQSGCYICLKASQKYVPFI